MDSLNPYNPFKDKIKGARYTQEQLDYIKQLLDIGWSPNRIHKEYGISVDSIRARMKSDNWLVSQNKRMHRLCQDELDKMHEMVDAGIPDKKIAKTFNVSVATVQRRRLNSQWKTADTRRYKFDENYFDEIDCEHKAYWLGFLMANGYILSARNRSQSPHENQSFGFAISTKDIELFDAFKKDLHATNPVHIYKNNGAGCFENSTPYGRILLTSQHAVDALKSHGLVENKTFICKMPDIEDTLKPAFIRGYSDGDGSISHDKNNRLSWGLCGTKELLSSFQDFFGIHYKLDKRWPERNNNNWSLKITGWINVPRCLDIIYKDATIYLKRKYDKYVEIQGSIV